jgi:MHS family shikimate/dehydroshikimate transporter-like MFS transporter
MSITGQVPLVERPDQHTTDMGRIVISSVIGTAVEWYDFVIYGIASALVFNKLFFPLSDPALGTIAAFGTYGVGFLARPVGAAIFGHFGDRVGRKAMLAMTIVVMGLGTFLVGLLPTYDQIGIAAPVLLVLLRLLQGIGLGGEWGGAVLMVVENAGARNRGLLGSMVQLGYPIGNLAAVGMLATLSQLPETEFLAWGWRIPFLISIFLLAIGTFVRARVPETPVFEGLKARDGLSSNPFTEAVGQNTKSFLIAVGLKLSEVSWVYMLTVFVVVYATTKLGLSKPMMLDAVLYAALLELITLPLFGWLSDKIGRRPLFIAGAIFTIVFAFPLFWMLESKSTAVIFIAMMIAMNLGHGLMFASESCYFPELFGPRVRYSGATFGFQLSAAIGGGFAPIVATAMAGYIGGTTGVSIMMIVLGSITLAAAIAARETAGRSLTE